MVGKTPHGATWEDSSTDRAPGVAPFPVFGPPQILVNEYSFDRVDLLEIVACLTTEYAKERQLVLEGEGRPGALAYAEIPSDPFLRTLAKIAHCYVVSQVGLDGFRPLLQNVILGKGYASYYVGGTGLLPAVVPSPAPETHHQIYPMTLTIREVGDIAVQIRLFAYLLPTPPIYTIVVGEYSASKGKPHPVFFGQKNFYAQTVKSFSALIEPAPL